MQLQYRAAPASRGRFPQGKRPLRFLCADIGTPLFCGCRLFVRNGIRFPKNPHSPHTRRPPEAVHALPVLLPRGAYQDSGSSFSCLILWLAYEHPATLPCLCKHVGPAAGTDEPCIRSGCEDTGHITRQPEHAGSRRQHDADPGARIRPSGRLPGSRGATGGRPPCRLAAYGWCRRRCSRRCQRNAGRGRSHG